MVINRHGDLLIKPQIPLRGLDGRVPEQKLDLFEIAATFTAQLGAGTAKIVSAEALDPNLLR